MMESWDGTLSSTEFYAAASTFSEQWRKFNSTLPQWSWLPSPKRLWISHNNQTGYLSLENVILPRLSEHELYGEAENHRIVKQRKIFEKKRGSNCKEDRQTEELIEKEECSSECVDEVVDPAVAVLNDGPGEHRYDFHAVYSASYRVPVLYFRAYHNDGQPLLLDEIEKDIPVDSAQLLARSKWTFMTQEEHPELNRPWYTLHPCGTSEWMKLLLGSDISVARGRIPVEKYMVSWFSVVGQVFGLKIPFEMLNLTVRSDSL